MNSIVVCHTTERTVRLSGTNMFGEKEIKIISVFIFAVTHNGTGKCKLHENNM